MRVEGAFSLVWGVLFGSSMLLAWSFAPGLARAQGLFEKALEGDLDVAEEDPGETGEHTVSEGLDNLLGGITRGFELNGFVRGDLFVGKTVDKEASELKAGYGEVGLGVRARAQDWGDGFGELRFLAGAQQGKVATELQVREAFLNLYLGPVDLRFGHQIIAWGRADGTNPTDNLTPRDLNIRSANADDRRLANLAARLHLTLDPAWLHGRARIELVWVPFYAPSKFPTFQLAGPIQLGELERPDFNLTKGIGALKIDLETSAFEASLSGLIGHATFPGLQLQSVTLPPGGPFTITAGFSSYRHLVVGFDFAAAISDWFGLRGEAAWRWPFDYQKRPDVPHPDLQWVVGIDREFAHGITVVAQYLGRWVYDWQKIPKYPMFASGSAPSPEELQKMQMQGLDPLVVIGDEIQRRAQMIHQQTVADSHAASLRISWLTLHDTLTLEVTGMVNFSTEEVMARPVLTYNISDALAVAAGGEVYLGPEDTLFGMTDQVLSAGFAELKLSF